MRGVDGPAKVYGARDDEGAVEQPLATLVRGLRLGEETEEDILLDRVCGQLCRRHLQHGAVVVDQRGTAAQESE